MARKAIPKRLQKGRKSFSLSKAIINRLEEVTKGSNIKDSEFIENLLRQVLFNDSAYAKLMAKDFRRKAAYWEYESKLAEERDQHKIEGKLTNY